MTVRNLDALLRPRTVWFLGEPSGKGQHALLERMARDGAFGFRHVRSELPRTAPAQMPLAAIVADARFATAPTITALGQLGCRALLWLIDEPPSADAMSAGRAFTMRVLGPRTVGLATPALGLDLTVFPQTPGRGSLALITQSQSVAAAAVDWATGRGIGFSLVAVVGGEADVDVADLLDYVALDRDTSAVAIELGAIRGARKFMSAARACARVKPTVVLQTRSADDAGLGADPVRSSAFARAGLVEVPTLPGLFDALAALERLPVMERGRVLVASNGSALCGLAVDAAIRQNLEVAEIPPDVRTAIQSIVPQARFQRGAADLGDPPVDRLVSALESLLSVPESDAVLYVRSPTAAASHEEVAGALADALPHSRLLTVWLGLESALPARRRSTAVRQPTFTSPDAAARAVRFRYEYSHNRVLLTQTPPRAMSAVLDRENVARMLALEPAPAVPPTIAAGIAAAYGVTVGGAPADALHLDCEIGCHRELGLHVRVTPRAFGVRIVPAFGFPPLDPLLADRLLEAAGLSPSNGVVLADRLAAGDALIRLTQLAMDHPCIARLSAMLTVAGGTARLSAAPGITIVSPLPPRARLALAPYPVEHERTVALASGAPVVVRAIRPTDEEDVIRLLQRIDTESIRLRFFSYVRHFSHAMAARMTQIDYDRELGLIAFTGDATPKAVGLATLISDPDGIEAEFAILIHQAIAREGLGRRLMEQMIEHARAIGLHRVTGDVLQENTAMLRLALRLGFTSRRHPHETGCLRVELDLHR